MGEAQRSCPSKLLERALEMREVPIDFQLALWETPQRTRVNEIGECLQVVTKSIGLVWAAVG